MSRKNMIGAVLFAILAPQLLPAQQQQMTLHNVSGEAPSTFHCVRHFPSMHLVSDILDLNKKLLF